MKKLFLGIFILGLSASAFAQKSVVNDLEKAWGIYQITGNSDKTSLDAKLKTLETSLANSEKAIQDEKSKVMPKLWSYRALFASTVALIDTNSIENSEKHLNLAVESVAKAKELDPKGSETENIANAEINIENAIRNGGIIAYNHKSYQVAYDKFMKAASMAKAPDTMMNLYAGIMAKELKNYPAMATQFKKVIDMGYPQAQDLYTELIGTALQLQKDTTVALGYIKEAQAKFPDNAEFLKTETQIYIDRGDVEKSEEKLNALLKSEPNNPVYHLLIGNVYFTQALKLQELRNTIDIKDKKKFEEVTKKMTDLLDKSLPYYKKTLELDAKSKPALETLKTIYAFKNDNANYEIVKKKLDELQ